MKYNNWLVKGLHRLTQFGQQMAKLYGKSSTRLATVTADSTDVSQTLAEMEVVDLWYTDGTQKSLVNTLSLKADLVGGLVPANQLPSYVDDVLEYADFASFPVTGETGKIYYANDTNSSYRWTGSTYYETNSTQEFYLRSSITNSTVGDIIALDTAQKSFLRFTAATTLHSLLGITVTNLNKLVIILNKNSSNLLIKNESLTESTATNRILTGTGIDIELLPNSSIILIYDYNSTRWHIIGGTGSGGGGGSNFDISQTNTFTKGQPIYYDTTTSEWKLAKVDDIAKEAKAVVTESGSPDFIATLSGLIEFESAEITAIIGSSAFVPGTTYYVSDSVAGTYTDLSPAISNPMLFAISTTTALVKPGFNALTSGVGESIVEQPFTSILNQTTFTLDFEPLGKAYTWVSLDGIGEFSDFTISGKDIVFTTPLSAGIEVHVRYIKSFKIDTRNNIIPITPITATVGQTIVNLPVVPQSSNYVLLWVNGARQYSSYSLVGNVLTFSSPLAGGEIIEGIIINAVNFDVGVDNYITRKTATLANTAETTIQTIFGENLSGEYRIKVVGTTRGGNMLFSTTDGLEGTLLGNTSGVYGTSSKLNIDFNSGTIRIQNLTGATIQLSIVREL